MSIGRRSRAGDARASVRVEDGQLAVESDLVARDRTTAGVRRVHEPAVRRHDDPTGRGFRRGHRRADGLQHSIVVDLIGRDRALIGAPPKASETNS